MKEYSGKNSEQTARKENWAIRHRAGLIGTGLSGVAFEQAVTGHFTTAAVVGGASLTTLGIEGMIEFTKRRLEPAKDLSPDSPELEKFKTEPNPAADILEESLGIKIET